MKKNILILLFVLSLWITQTERWNIIEWCFIVRGYCRKQYAFDIQQKLFNLWYSENDTIIIINNCKKAEKEWLKTSVGQCIRTAGMIWFVESSGWKHCYKNNCMWLYDWRKSYKDKDEMFKDRMERYKKYWYNHYKVNDYYWKNPITHYCASKNEYVVKNAEKAFYILNK